ncbi:MAG: tetratricopeptide repeat protein [Proteobacteria bacterium]|nr:tetratricopeptide repeat protein [Pseudomonadota bacterium]
MTDDTSDRYLLSGKKPFYEELKEMYDQQLYDFVIEKIMDLSVEEQNRTENMFIQALSYIAKGQYDDAKGILDSILHRDDLPEDSLSFIASKYREAGMPKDALRICQAGMIADARSVKIVFEMGMAYDDLGHPEIAILYLKRAYRINRICKIIDDRLLIEKMMSIYLKLNQFDNAGMISANQAILKDNPVHMLGMAKYSADQGNFTEALSYIEKASRLSSDRVLIINRAQFFLMNGQPDKAIHILDGLDTGGLDDDSITQMHIARSLAFGISNDHNMAFNELISAEKTAKRAPVIHLIKSLILFCADHRELAERELRKAFGILNGFFSVENVTRGIHSDKFDRDMGLAFFCMDLGYCHQAVKISQKALLKEPDNIFHHYIIAESSLKAGEHALARIELDFLSYAINGDVPFKMALAKRYEKSDYPERALIIYADLIDEKPDFKDARLAYGALLLELKQYQKSHDILMAGLYYHPESFSVLLAIGWACCYLQDIDGLDTVLQQLMNGDLSGHYAVAHLNGWRAYLKNDLSGSEKFLKVALDLSPGEPEICYHLGVALYAAGKKEQAVNLFDQALLFDAQRKAYSKDVARMIEK